MFDRACWGVDHTRMFNSRSHTPRRRLLVDLYRREAMFDEDPRWGFTRKSRHSYRCFHLGPYNLIVDLREPEVVEPLSDAAHHNH